MEQFNDLDFVTPAHVDQLVWEKPGNNLSIIGDNVQVRVSDKVRQHGRGFTLSFKFKKGDALRLGLVDNPYITFAVLESQHRIYFKLTEQADGFIFQTYNNSKVDRYFRATTYDYTTWKEREGDYRLKYDSFRRLFFIDYEQHKSERIVCP